MAVTLTAADGKFSLGAVTAENSDDCISVARESHGGFVTCGAERLQELSKASTLVQLEHSAAEFNVGAMPPIMLDEEQVNDEPWAFGGETLRRYLQQQLGTFSGVTTDGVQVSAQSLRGQVVLLDFWSTYCGPCVAEIPELRELFEEWRGEGFTILGVSDERTPQPAFRERLRRLDVPWPQILLSTTQAHFGVRGVPTYVLIDRDGKVRAATLRGPPLYRAVQSLVRSHTMPDWTTMAGP